jgi:thiamine monophosphate kinase
MEQVSTLVSAATDTLAQESSTLLAATETILDGENASIEIFSDAAVGGAQPAATFAAVGLPTGPQLDPNYQPVLPYLAR